jgi:hypothetical protein
MATATYERERHSSRVFRRVRVVVAGKNRNARRFRAVCETVVINAHGGLVYLDQPLDMNGMLVLTNPSTQEEQECRIVYLGDETGKGQRVGLEFLTPAPHFWGIEFAQPDWGTVPPYSNHSDED